MLRWRLKWTWLRQNVKHSQFVAVIYTSSGLIYSVRAKSEAQICKHLHTGTTTSTTWNGRYAKFYLHFFPFPEHQPIDTLSHKTTVTKAHWYCCTGSFSSVFCQPDITTLHNSVNWLLIRTTPLRLSRLFFLAIKGHGLHGGEDSAQGCFNRPPVHYIGHYLHATLNHR